MTATIAETSPHVTDEETGQRFYEIDGEKFWSVTTAIGVIGKDRLTFWSAGLAAGFAFDELPTILTSSRIRPCGRTYHRCQHDWRMPHIPGECACRTCEACVRRQMTELHDVTKKRRADEGRRTHAVIEWWAEHDGEWIGFDADIAVYVAAFQAFCAEYGITPDDFLLTERVVINREHKYAGMTDGVLAIYADRTTAAAEVVARLLSKTIGEKIAATEAAEQHLSITVVIDFKTKDKATEDVKFYPEGALQLSGYRFGQVCRLKNLDSEEPMPHTDGAMLIFLCLNGAVPRLTVADESTFEGFLMALGLFRWLHEYGTASVSTRSFPLPKPAGPAKAVKPRAVRKTAAVKPPARAAVAKQLPSVARPVASTRTLPERLGIDGAYSAARSGLIPEDELPF